MQNNGVNGHKTSFEENQSTGCEGNASSVCDMNILFANSVSTSLRVLVSKAQGLL